MEALCAPLAFISPRLLRWCCSCHCCASENPFGWAAFPNIQLFPPSPFCSLFLSHLSMVSAHTVSVLTPSVIPCLCMCSLSLYLLFCQRTNTSFCSMLIPLELHYPHFFLRKIHTQRPDCSPWLFIAVLLWPQTLHLLALLLLFSCVVSLVAGDHSFSWLCELLVAFSLDIEVWGGIHRQSFRQAVRKGRTLMWWALVCEGAQTGGVKD